MKPHIVLAAVGIACAPALARAGTLDRLDKLDLTDQVVDGIGKSVDFGVEASVLGTAARDDVDAAVEVDLALAVFSDRKAIGKPRLSRRILAHALGLTTPPARPPMLSRPRFEAHVGGVFDLGGDRRQLHLSTGSGVGPVGIAIAASREYTDAGGAWAMGPELRVRHRFGPGRRTPSVGVVLRGDFFLEDRAAHPDRVSLGVFGMFDVL
jgi:hypothetical protein